MARLLTTGWEFNDLINNSGVAPAEAISPVLASGVTNQASVVRSGARALQVPIASGTALGVTLTNYKNVASGTRFFRVYLYVDVLPANTIRVVAQNSVLWVKLTSSGTLQLWNSSSNTQIGSDSTAITAGQWFRVELKSVLDASGLLTAAELQLDGLSVAAVSGLSGGNVGTSPIDVGALGDDPGINMNVYLDDAAMNDASGANQSSWPGAGNVVLLRPTADNAVGTGWTLGNATAAGGNAWQRLDNAPPDSATDLTTAADADQIRNATSNASVNYDATMTTYTAAGVTGTVNVLVPMVATGAPVVTSAKAGTVGVVSNPAITNISLGAGGTSGAFWSGVAMGTYPTGNKWSFGTTTYAPAVTLGTAPVMRVTQVTASTRIAIVTEMGIYVDYTPAVAVLPPLPVYVDSAVARSTSY